MLNGMAEKLKTKISLVSHHKVINIFALTDVTAIAKMHISAFYKGKNIEGL